MSSRQALDVHGSGAHARPTHHQPVPSQYKSGGLWIRGTRRYGLAVGRRKAYSGVPTQILLGEMSCWDDIPPKKRKDELEPLGAYHEG